MDAPAPITTLAVDYSDGETTFEGYLATPAGLTAPRPGVLVGHDWAGLHDGVKQIADRLAAQGHPAFALDAYGKGVRGELGADNSALMNPLMADRGLLRRRLLAALAAAGARPEIDAGAMAIVGYCFGGMCALDLARAAPPALKAAVSVHGVYHAPGLGPQAPITASVLVLHGWADPMTPPADAAALARELTDAGADWQIHAYGHAMHAFTHEGANLPERGIAYDAHAARRSWAATLAHLAETLG
jgi:dienelactone hydrolase